MLIKTRFVKATNGPENEFKRAGEYANLTFTRAYYFQEILKRAFFKYFEKLLHTFDSNQKPDSLMPLMGRKMNSSAPASMQI